MAELQKDPMTRSDFLSFGLLSTIAGAILTIPPAAFVLGPVIRTTVLGQSNVSDNWQAVGPISEVPTGEPKDFVVEFPIDQTYATDDIQEESDLSSDDATVRNAIWVSWRTEVEEGKPAEAKRPSFLDGKSSGFTESEKEEILNNLNVLSNSCAHLGCPVRWYPAEQEFLCPCHGGLYTINGKHIGGPPPRGMYEYVTRRIGDDGTLYVKHEYDVGPEYDNGPQEPYVV